MSDPLEPKGEYTDSELPLDAELPTEEYEEVEEILDDEGLSDEDVEVDVIDVVEVDDDERGGSVPN